MIPHVTRLLELWRIAAHYRLDTLVPAEEIPVKARPVLNLIRLHPAAWSSKERKNSLKLKEARPDTTRDSGTAGAVTGQSQAFSS